MQSFCITENFSKKRIDRVIRSIFPNIPISAIYKYFRTKKILLNGKKVKENYIVNERDKITWVFKDEFIEKKKISFDFEKFRKTKFYTENLEILFEDNDMLILNKPSGIPVHPGTNHRKGKTMTDLAEGYIGETKFPVTLIHRLDLTTSGILVFAKNNLSLQNLNKQMKEKKVIKKYYALVNGNLKKDKGTISLYLERTLGKQKSTKIIISKDKANAMRAVTHYEVLKRFSNIATLISVRLETGRMHQIRVHMKSQGHVLWGDERYGDFKLNREIEKKYGLKRMFLHSYYMEIIHPKTGKKVEVNCNLPRELSIVLNKLSGPDKMF